MKKLKEKLVPLWIYYNIEFAFVFVFIVRTSNHVELSSALELIPSRAVLIFCCFSPHVLRAKLKRAELKDCYSKIEEHHHKYCPQMNHE
jgi:hypothetical protein